jgi:hypothetical protein
MADKYFVLDRHPQIKLCDDILHWAPMSVFRISTNGPTCVPALIEHPEIQSPDSAHADHRHVAAGIAILKLYKIPFERTKRG